MVQGATIPNFDLTKPLFSLTIGEYLSLTNNTVRTAFDEKVKDLIPDDPFLYLLTSME
ncbi:MAG: hypothetical protein RLZZ292_888 [Bacteroidota bacterium]|jgi:hypothetical protein